MKLQYRSHCCPTQPEPVKLSKSEGIFDRLLSTYIRQLFDERGITELLRVKLWTQYFDKLVAALDIGYSPEIKQYDAGLAYSLKYNIAEFSAFKESSFRKQLESFLIKDGKIVKWSEFKKQAFAISEDYNKRWLETEYHHTVATANMASKWENFKVNKELYPNLQYVTAGDSRVREKHAKWDGLILPMDHSFWSKNYPPNDWGCRCDVIQTDEDVTKDIPNTDSKSGFNNNPAKTGKIFNGNPYEDGLSKEEIKTIQENAKIDFKKATEESKKKKP